MGETSQHDIPMPLFYRVAKLKYTGTGFTKWTSSLVQYQNVHMISPSFPRSCYGGTYAWRVLGSETRVYAPETHGVPAHSIRCYRRARGGGMARRATEPGPATPYPARSGLAAAGLRHVSPGHR